LAQTNQQKGNFTTIPVEIVLEFQGSGIFFAAYSLWASAKVGLYLNNGLIPIRVSSVSVDKTNIATGLPVTLQAHGLDAKLNIEKSSDSIAWKHNEPNNSWTFQQIWNADLTFTLSDQI